MKNRQSESGIRVQECRKEFWLMFWSWSSDLPVFSPKPWLLTASTIFFGLAILHSFSTQQILNLSRRFSAGSFSRNLMHFLGEVEVVFGLWAFAFVALVAFCAGSTQALSFLQTINFTEPTFVFVIMCMSATKPVTQIAGDAISLMARIFPGPAHFSFYLSALTLGPLLGSFITEPAAMTVVALLLKQKFYEYSISRRFKYATVALLFVNVSLGGMFTNFAAPPVLMVATQWGWTTPFMLTHFGWKCALVIFFNTTATAFYFRSELATLDKNEKEKFTKVRVPAVMVISHLLFIFLCVIYHDYLNFFLPLFLLFLGWYKVTKKWQEPLKLRGSLLVGVFLGGLVILGNLQGWWLKPMLSSLTEFQLFLWATGLTSVTDNAALTFLGSLVPSLNQAAKYALVAGAVAGGGLTIMANAPNPAGYGILQDSFGDDGISPWSLFMAALPYTLCAMFGLYLL